MRRLHHHEKHLRIRGNQAPQFGTGKFYNFVTPKEGAKIYYHPDTPGRDTSPLRDIYTLIPLS
jgi:hypothetical protein